MKYKLSEENVAAIEKALNYPGITEATVKVENGEIVILMIEKKKIS